LKPVGTRKRGSQKGFLLVSKSHSQEAWNASTPRKYRRRAHEQQDWRHAGELVFPVDRFLDSLSADADAGEMLGRVEGLNGPDPVLLPLSARSIFEPQSFGGYK
jgi:hypothetical protein